MYSLVIETDNDAFVENPTAELARILRKQAAILECSVADEDFRIKVKDINGNTAGEAWYMAPEQDDE